MTYITFEDQSQACNTQPCPPGMHVRIGMPRLQRSALPGMPESQRTAFVWACFLACVQHCILLSISLH